MTKEERYLRYKYLTGLNAWEIASFQDPENVVVLNDGPSGLRKPTKNGFTEQQEVIQTVCMPTPSALAASFNKDACYVNGSLIAKECLHHKTNILLAPGVNIKRFALCGRNFEYFSEDPYLAGILAAAYVRGLEDNNVGACVKHFACNSQEHARTINSSEITLRALNEIYLRVFKYIIEYSNPTAIMTSYNKINGEYINESKYIIQDKLRKEYGFKGLIMSDWCAVSDKAATFKTGLNIEMPLSKMSYEMMDRGYGTIFNDEDLIARDNELHESLKKFKVKPYLETLDLDELHSSAVNIANETMVLVKNDNNYLPFNENDKVLVLGYFANHARFVGLGSGWVNAYKHETFIDVLDKKGTNYTFVECFDENKVTVSYEELEKLKGKYNKVVLFLGQYHYDESEGYDRSSIEIRPQQLEVLRMVKNIFNNFATVLVSGSVVNIKEIYENSDSMMITYLAGEGQSEAIYNNVFGLSNPSGRLPETWISSLEQNPINEEYKRRDIYHTYYHDDIFVGYRYYDAHDIGFYLPFGYGLSYSDFKYENYKYEIRKNKLIVTLDVANESDVDGATVVQAYVGKEKSKIYRPIKELKGFCKVFAKSHETKSCEIEINLKDLASYRNESDSFEIEEGQYEIYVSLNSNEVLDKHIINVSGVEFNECKEPEKLVKKEIPSDYSFDSPGGLLLENELFKKYVAEHNLNIDISNFEKRYWFIDSKALRVTICDGDFNITFEEMEELIKYLNSQPHNLKDRIHFDDIVKKYRP